MTPAIRSVLEAIGIDPEEALCPATTVSRGDLVRCQKPFDGHPAHVGKSGRWDVVW